MLYRDDELVDATLYVVFGEDKSILKIYGNEENAYIYATRKSIEYMKKNYDMHGKLDDELDLIDADESADFKRKLSYIHRYIGVMFYVEEHELNTDGSFYFD